MDTSSRDRSLRASRAVHGVGVGTTSCGPSPARARDQGGVGAPNSRPAHPGTARAPGRQARLGRVGCGSPADWEGAPVRRGRGRGLDPPGAGAGGRLRAAPGARPRWRVGDQAGPRRGSQTQKGNFAPGGRGLRLRCGGREGEGGELASSRGGGRVCREVNAGRSHQAWGGLAETAGAAGGGAARPQRRPPAPRDRLQLRWVDVEGGWVSGKGMGAEGTGGGPRGSLTAYPGAVGPHVPPQAAEAAAPAPLLLPPPPPPSSTPATAA